MAESLRASGKESGRLSMPFLPKAAGDFLDTRDGGGSPITQPEGSIISMQSIGSDSPLQSQRASRRNTILTGRNLGTPLTLEQLRKIVAQPVEIFQVRE